MEVVFPRAYQELFRPHRYKVYYGGRGSGKSWSAARALLLLGYDRPLRILCAREIQHSISDSVHRLLAEQVNELGLDGFYRVTQTSITGANGTEFIFKGLRFNAREIKSTEGVNVAWVEEAQAVSAESWDILIPTIRSAGSEIWITFNPLDESDPTYQRFIQAPPAGAYVRKVNYDENPYFPDVLKTELEWLRSRDYESYMHIWEGEVRQHSNAVIFAGRFRVEEFETPVDARFYHGADWGFAQDPTTLVRCYINGKTLYIDREAWGVGVDLDDTPALFDTIETARSWPIKADNARPETISFMRRRGFRISGAKKWAGSIEDGIEYLKSYDIVVHPRCRHTIDELAHYSYKVDRQTGDVLPVIVDAWNHCLTGDTKVLCKDGEKEIKDIRPGELVQTRQGLRRVTWSGKTRDNAHVYTVYADDGYRVTGTADHRVFTVNRGWIMIGYIEKGDVLLCMQKQSKHTAKYGEGIQTPAGDLIENTSSAGRSGCTDIPGSKSMGQSRPAWSYTTRTETAKTTRSIISNASQNENTPAGIPWTENDSKNSVRSWTQLGTKQKDGTPATKGGHGIENTLASMTLDTITASRGSASNAADLSSQKPRIMNSAQTLAKAHGDGRPGSTTRQESAENADSLLKLINTPGLNVVLKVVQCVEDGGIAPAVYDLTVESDHEFFANGVLVHNCLDATRYALDGMIKGRGQMRINPAVLGVMTA